jgi:hypothetical protein
MREPFEHEGGIGHSKSTEKLLLISMRVLAGIHAAHMREKRSSANS